MTLRWPKTPESIALVAYVVLALALFPLYRYQINPDATSYVSIAKKYAAGEFYEAIGSHWAPLLSWLLVPLIKLGVYPAFAAKGLMVAAGFAGLAGSIALTRLIPLEKWTRAVVLTLFVLSFLYFSMVLITPDIISVALLLWVYVLLWRDSYGLGWWHGLLLGLLAGLAYLGKNYHFYYLPPYLIAIHSAKWFLFTDRLARRRLVRAGVATAVVYLGICSAWIVGMHWKYGEWTAGSAGTYTHEWLGPESEGHSMDDRGFLTPPNATAVSAWEDPSLYPMKDWSPFSSWNSLGYQVKLFLTNLVDSVRLRAIAPLLLLYLCWRRRLALEWSIAYLMFAIALYTFGYLLIHVEPRLVWSSRILCMIATFYLLDRLTADRAAWGLRRWIWPYWIVVLLYVYTPFSQLYDVAGSGKDSWELANRLKTEYGVTGAVASNRGTWHRGLQLSYYLDTQYFGHPQEDWTDEEIAAELEKQAIDYYFVFTPLEGGDDTEVESEALVNHYPEITGGMIHGLRIYHVRAKRSP